MSDNARKYQRHGMYGTPEYKSYIHAKGRCTTPTDYKYPLYGARGIKFKFSSFQEFYKELGKRPTLNHSIERIDNDGNYEPGNCKWATKEEQCLNQRKRSDNKSGFRGVSQHKRTLKWQAYISVNKKLLWLGEYKDALEAAYIRDQFAQQIYGKTYKTNTLELA